MIKSIKEGGEIKPENYFRLNNGKPIKNLNELLDALKDIDDETFYHHVSESRNDFYEWIKNIIKDQYLADMIKALKDKTEIRNVIEIRLFGMKKNLKSQEYDIADTAKPKPKQEKKTQKKAELAIKLLKNQEKKESKQDFNKDEIIIKDNPSKTKNKKDKPASEKKGEPNRQARLITTKIKSLFSKDKEKGQMASEKKPAQAIGLVSNQRDILLEVREAQKIISEREKEIKKKEKIIQEVEGRIESKLAELDEKKKFFSKEFLQGLGIGILISIVAALIYVRSFL